MVATALGDRKAVAPLYRFPGFGRSTALEQHLASHGIMAWSIARVIARFERKGRGILVVHDNQPETARALLKLLRELRARYFRVAHVLPAVFATTSRR